MKNLYLVVFCSVFALESYGQARPTDPEDRAAESEMIRNVNDASEATRNLRLEDRGRRRGSGWRRLVDPTRPRRSVNPDANTNASVAAAPEQNATTPGEVNTNDGVSVPYVRGNVQDSYWEYFIENNPIVGKHTVIRGHDITHIRSSDDKKYWGPAYRLINYGDNGNVIAARSARGTESKPDYLKKNSNIFAVRSIAVNRKKEKHGIAEMMFRTSENHSAQRGGQDIIFRAVPQGTTKAKTVMKLKGDGDILVGADRPAVNGYLVNSPLLKNARKYSFNGPSAVGLQVVGYGNAGYERGILQLANARGTSERPAATRKDDTLGTIQFRGYTGSKYEFGKARASIGSKATSNFSSNGNQGANLVFGTSSPKDSGNKATVERMRITDEGNIGVGTKKPEAKMHIVGNLIVTGKIIGKVSSTAATGNRPVFPGNESGGTSVGYSDIRFKKDIESISSESGSALEKIQKINGRYYFWRANEFADRGFSYKRDMGVIAQEIESVFPEAVETDENGYKGVAYGKLVAPVIEAIKELDKKTQRISALEKENQMMKEFLCSKHKNAPFCE